MTAMTPEERQRRHDERWQKEVLDGMARMLDVLHDISDQLQILKSQGRQRPTPLPQRPESDDRQPVLMSVDALAEHLGITANAVRGLQVGDRGPIITRIGRRIYYHRVDVERWLDQMRLRPDDEFRSWRGSHPPGRIGSRLPASSARPERPWCEGSHSEPIAAGRYHGRGTCRLCKDEVLINKDGRLRQHHARSW